MNSLPVRMKRRLWQMVKLLALAAVAGGLIYWLKFSPLPVREHEVKLGDIVAEVMGTGTLEAHFKSTISPRISGRIQEVSVDMGDMVTAGQLLVRLDDVDMKPQVAIAEASVVVSQSALESTPSGSRSGPRGLGTGCRRSRTSLRLRPGGAISQEDVDKTTANWKIAQAGVARAEAAIVEGRKQLLAAETSLAYRKALLGDTEIVCPFRRADCRAATRPRRHRRSWKCCSDPHFDQGIVDHGLGR